MSGIRPDMTGIFNFANHIRDPGFNSIVSMPQQFKKWNYTVLGGGKTYHYDHPPYFDDTGRTGSWSSEVAPYFFFREYSGSVDFAQCPLPPGYVQNPAKLGPQVCVLAMCRLHEHACASHTRVSADGTTPVSCVPYTPGPSFTARAVPAGVRDGWAAGSVL